jgi:hypothetical protein
MAEWSCDTAIIIPQIMPATTIKTATGKLTDDAFMFGLRDFPEKILPPANQCTIMCN